MTIRTVSKFFAVHAVPNHSDDWELVGIFSLSSDAAAFVEEQRKSGNFLGVADPQPLEMPVILDILLRDRLRELADPIVKLVAVMGQGNQCSAAGCLLDGVQHDGYPGRAE